VGTDGCEAGKRKRGKLNEIVIGIKGEAVECRADASERSLAQFHFKEFRCWN
jgi:hypothetical protein